MYKLFIGNHESIIGVEDAYIEMNNKFVRCKVVGYLYKSMKYQVVTEDARTFNVNKIYFERKVN